MASTNLITALGAGSGVDVKALAENLVEAERAPRKERIEAKITQSEAKISGYGALKFALSELQTALKTLNDAKDFSAVTASSSQSSAVGVTASSSASLGEYSIEVLNTALAQRTASSSFESNATTLNGGVAFSLDLTLGGVSMGSIDVTTATPDGMVSAINTADLGVTAQLINTGSGYNVVLTGSTGSANTFSMTSNDGSAGEVTGVSFITSLQDATDASFKVNGLTVSRSNNAVTDVISGVTLNLYTATSGAARVNLNSDTSTLKTNIQGLVTAYNNFSDSVKILGDRTSDVKEFGGALAGDNLLRSIKSQVRSMITGDFTLYTDEENKTGALNSNINAAWQVGLGFDRNGKMSLDETKLDSAFNLYSSEVVTLFTADTNDLSVFSTASAGLAGTAVRDIDVMLRSTSLLTEQTANTAEKVDLYKADLVKLEERMKALLERYTKQFSLMDSIVGSSNSTRDSMKSSFDGMMASYTNN
jgi:flagellar hook-associated protein 2